VDTDENAGGDLVDPADVLSAETVAELATRLAGADPLDIVDEVMDTGDEWWIGLDPVVLDVLTCLARDLLDDSAHDLAMVGLVRAGYRLGRLLTGDEPHAAPGPPLVDHLNSLETLDGALLLEQLPDEAAPLSLWLSEELIRRNGWWRGRMDEVDEDQVPGDLQELRGAGIAAADLGLCASLLEHDLLSRGR
jgi:hypothetical protein